MALTSAYTEVELQQFVRDARYHAEQAALGAAAWRKAKAKLERTPEFAKAVEQDRRKFYAVNWDMSDGQEKWNWHRREQARLEGILQMEFNIAALNDMDE